MQNTDTIIPLSSLETGASASIIGFSEKGSEISNRLFELGFVNGSIITASGKAPFGNPLVFTIHGGKLALRKEDAKSVLVRKL
ncbi:MAG TPA: FeoA family protein [Methanocorpusculum sp.]|nr:FeoA family protein [Methanocorpusculum sp.]